MKKVVLSLVVVLMLSVMLVPMSMAQGPAYSSIQVLNLGTTDATIMIYYYNQDGTEDPASPISDTVLEGLSNTYFPVHAQDGFNGSVVIESTEPVAVISNILYLSNPMIQSSWVGFEGGASTIRFPLIMKGNNSNDTTFNVQNVTDTAVDITIEFVPEPGSSYAAISNVTDTLAPFAAHSYDQATMSQFSGVTKWVGSAKVTAQGAGQVVGVAQQIDSARLTGTAYNAFLGGSPTVEMPLVMKENNNMWTSINCQNLGSGPTDVTVTFTPESGYPAMATETKTGIPANGTAVFIQYGAPKWVGAATVTNTAGYELACIGNQQNLVNLYASSYEGFAAADTSASVVVPLIQFQSQADGALWSSINIKNLGGTATTATVDFKPAPGFADITNLTVDIAGNAVGVILFYNPYADNTNAIGGAEITSSNGNALAVVVNQQKFGYTGDVYSSYNGFAK